MQSVQCPPTPRPIKIGGVVLTRVLGKDCSTLKHLSDDVVLAMTNDKKYQTMNIEDRQYLSELTEEHFEYKIKDMFPQLQHLPHEYETWTKLYEFLMLSDHIRLVKLYLPLLRLSAFTSGSTLLSTHTYNCVTIKIDQDYTLTITALPNGLWSVSSSHYNDLGLQVKETKPNVNTIELLSNLSYVKINDVKIV
jgi:hypothetical protein